jgi:hypothetical protein
MAQMQFTVQTQTKICADAVSLTVSERAKEVIAIGR